MNDRQKTIHDKGFNLDFRLEEIPSVDKTMDYRKIKVGLKSLEDAVLNLNAFGKSYLEFGDKEVITKALAEQNYAKLRELSNFYYNLDGIYQRLCKYIAFLYRYDWYVIPYLNQDKKENKNKVLSDFSKVLSFLDSSNVKKVAGDICLNIIKNGCYYGYIVPSEDKLILQDLPTSYCRSRYSSAGEPAVEFNMKYFDDQFKDTQYRLKVLSLFPKEFSKGYVLYKEGKLKGEYAGDGDGWYLLDTNYSVKLNLNNNDCPIFASVIPAIIDLVNAQELDRKKTMQQLLKIIIQKLPRDKNGDLIFDGDEAKDLHNNAVRMLKKAIGVDVLTTFADVEVADMSDRNTATSIDGLTKVERSVFNAAGVSNNLFNTDGNTALDRSILNDEGATRNMLFQIEWLLNKATAHFSKNKKKYYFRVKMLETTQYNYKDLSKMYKEQVQIGYSKMLPQVAMGHSQSEILAMIHFENDLLNLSEVMIPPLMSSTMNAESLGKNNQSTSSESEKKVGREEKPDNEKSEKTIQNRESMS